MERRDSSMVTASDRFDIDRQRIFRDIGYPPNSEPSARMVSLVNDYIENAYEFISPSFSYAVRDVKLVNGTSSIIEDGIVFESGVIARLLEKASKVAVFVLTIGKYLEDTAAKLAQDGLVLQSAVLDAIGSDGAERLADSVEGQISEVAHNQGLTIGRRFSPGYCDWDVSQQEMVFQAMKGDYDLIVIGARSLQGPLKRLMVDQVTPHVVDRSPCSVLVVRPGLDNG